jgi:hypothetical protein
MLILPRIGWHRLKASWTLCSKNEDVRSGPARSEAHAKHHQDWDRNNSPARSTIGNVAPSIPSGIRTVTVPITISIVGPGMIGIAAPVGGDGSDIRCAVPDL